MRTTGVIAALLILIVVTWQTNWVGDHAITGILVKVFAVDILLALGIWFFFYSAHSATTREVVGRGAVVALIVLGFSVRLERPTGDLGLRWRWAWTPERTAPPLPDVTAPAGRIDLAATTPQDFPQFGGPQRNLKLPAAPLAVDWKRRPPRLLWRRPIGAGWSAFAAVNGYAVTMEQREDQELVTCYQIGSGQLMWANGVTAMHDSAMGGLGPRSTPSIHRGRVYALGATGWLRCLEGADGLVVWEQDLLREFGVPPDGDQAEIGWGRANSPLLVDGLLVIPAGGPADGPRHSLAAYDAETGQRRWTGGSDQISYSSPVVMTLAGVRQIVSVNEATVSGHRIADGVVLWSVPWAGSSSGSANTSQPMQIDANRLLVSKGYNRGAAEIVVRAAGGALTAEFGKSSGRVLRTKLTSAIVHDGFAYGLNDGILQCVDLATFRSQWKSDRLKHGQPLLVGELLLVMSEWGDLHLYAASPRPPDGPLAVLENAVTGTAWNNLCLYGDVLLVRSNQEAAAYRLPLR